MKYGSIEEGIANSNDTEINLTINPEDPFGEKEIFDNDDFWDDIQRICENENISREKAQHKARVNWLTAKFEKDQPGKHLLEHLLTNVHDSYLECATQAVEGIHHYPTFVYELSEFALCILEQDNVGKESYSKFLFGEDNSRTILHIAAERSLTQIIKYIVEFYPDIVYHTQNVNNDEYYPLHFLLLKKDENLSEYLQKETDASACFLVSVMNHERVRNLFQSVNRKKASFFFKDFIIRDSYKRTCLAILDCQVNPDWPFLHEGKKEKGDQFTSCIPNVPVRYHFFYRILDGDDCGRPPSFASFNRSAKTCLQLLAENHSNQEAINHPAVRTLVRYKWETYAKYIVWGNMSLYSLFLVMLSIGLFLQPHDRSSTTYNGGKDTLRAICEIGCLLFTLLYAISEAMQLRAEGKNYFRDPFNYLDNIGILCIVLVVPLRYTNHRDVELIVAGIGFAINFIRIVKYFPASRTLGVYINTIAKICRDDVSKFFVVFFIVMFGFTGMIYMMLLGTGDLSLAGGFWKILLKETRALAEASPFSEDYTTYKVWMIIVLMINMAVIMVVLLNLLIGQISYRYEEALNMASIGYDVDRLKLVIKAENTPLNFFIDFRVKYYREADFVANEEVAEELVEDWLAAKQHDKIEKRQKAIKEFLKSKLVKRRSMKHDAKSGSIYAPE